MAKQKILDTQKKVGTKTITITETIEREYDIDDLKQIKKNYENKIARVDKEMIAVTSQRTKYEDELASIDNYIAELEKGVE